MAQGWCKPAKKWYCHRCSEGWWRPPAKGLVTCKHKQDLLDRMATMAGLSGRAVGFAHEEINRSSSWPLEDRRIGAVEATNEALATPATRLVGSTMMPRMYGGVRPLDQRMPRSMRLLKIASSVQGLDLPHCPRQLRKPLIRQGRLPRGQIPLSHQTKQASCAPSPKNWRALGTTCAASALGYLMAEVSQACPARY